MNTTRITSARARLLAEDEGVALTGLEGKGCKHRSDNDGGMNCLLSAGSVEARQRKKYKKVEEVAYSPLVTHYVGMPMY